MSGAVEVGGVWYVPQALPLDTDHDDACDTCVAAANSKLCSALPACYTQTGPQGEWQHIIFTKQED